MICNPKVSVIVPVYNVENYLRECLDSIVNQSLEDIEIICVNDGSTDGSMPILEEYAQKDDRILIVNQDNRGAGAARNNGLQYAKGKYLSLLDGDDFFHKDMLKTAVERAENLNAQIVMYRTQQYFEKDSRYVSCPWTIKSELLPDKHVFSANDIEKNIFYAILGYTWDKLFLTEYVKSNNFYFQEQPVFNDAFFVYTALLKAERVTLIDQCLCFQRKRRAMTSITDRRSRFTDCAYGLLKGLKIFLEENSLVDRYKQDFTNYAVHLFTEDLKGKTGRNLQKEISSLKTKWMKELDLIKPDEYYYNLKQYQKLFTMVYDESNVLDLSFNQGIENIVIPVVYATDYNYLKITLASMCSILMHPTINITYRFVVLTPKGDSERYRELINNTLHIYKNFTLEIYEMGDEFDNAYLKLKDITTPTYYRLLLPEILKDCEKCIYMDGDTIVLDDLFNLYSIDLENNYIGAVEAPGYYENKQHHMTRLGIAEGEKFIYYNAGVLLMNLKQLREDGCVEKFMSLIGEKLESQDQDIINIVCKGRITQISAAYNIMTKYNRWDDEYFISIIGEAAYEKYKHQIIKPVIIHYADKTKPWNKVGIKYAEHWWKVVLSTPCWNLFADEKTDLLVNTACNQQVISVTYLTDSIQKTESEKQKIETELQKSKNEVQKIKNENIRLKKELKSISNSVSFKAGRIITFIPRKIRGGIKCFKDNGWVYTVKRFFEKIKNKIK